MSAKHRQTVEQIKALELDLLHAKAQLQSEFPFLPGNSTIKMRKISSDDVVETDRFIAVFDYRK